MVSSKPKPSLRRRDGSNDDNRRRPRAPGARGYRGRRRRPRRGRDVLFPGRPPLLRGDAGVAAPTLAATGSGDSGLPAIDFPTTLRGGRLVTLRILGCSSDLGDGAGWPGAEQRAYRCRASIRALVARFSGRRRRSSSTCRVAARAGPTCRSWASSASSVYGVDTLGDEDSCSPGPEAVIVPAPG